jgi:2-oxoglutarate ferredoxin oxidoreductase subunit beta
VRKAKQAIKLAFRAQLAGLGMSLVEVLSPCPVNWKVEPVKALEWLAKHLIPHYPPGEYKITEAVTALKKETGHA